MKFHNTIQIQIQEDICAKAKGLRRKPSRQKHSRILS